MFIFKFIIAAVIYLIVAFAIAVVVGKAIKFGMGGGRDEQ